MDIRAAFRLAAARAQLPTFRALEETMDRLRGEDTARFRREASALESEPFDGLFPRIPLSALLEQIEPGLMAALLPIVDDAGAAQAA